MLLEAWELPEAERKKAIRRLYLRWHPDKNPKSYDLCNEAFKFLKNQVTNCLRLAYITNFRKFGQFSFEIWIVG
jgi:sacsin